MVRKIVFYKSYFLDFYNEQTLAVRKKIDYVIGLVRDLPKIPEKFFKHIADTDGLYEIRVEIGSNIYRVFSFF